MNSPAYKVRHKGDQIMGLPAGITVANTFHKTQTKATCCTVFTSNIIDQIWKQKDCW